MGDLAYLRKDIEPKPSDFRQPFGLFAIPDWMFTERPHLVSRSDPKVLAYVCQECGLIEPKRVANGYIRRECACERLMRDSLGHAEFKAETQAQVDTQKTNRTYTWLGESEDDLTGKSFDNFSRQFQIKAYDECENWTKRFLQARQYNDTFSLNVLLMGGYGTGKTHLAAAIVNTLRAQCIPCLFCTAQSFFNALYSKDFDGKLHLIEQAAMTPLLVIDELDKLYVRADTDGAYQKRTLFDILDKRYKQRLPTIMTTNEQSDLSTWLDGATMSRLYERVTALPMNGLDYRTRL